MDIIEILAREVRVEAARRQRFLDAIFWTGIMVLFLASIVIGLFLLFDLPPFGSGHMNTVEYYRVPEGLLRILNGGRS